MHCVHVCIYEKRKATMQEDITTNDQEQTAQQVQKKRELKSEKTSGPVQQQMMYHQAAAGIQCPVCGAANDAGATFCASCGAALHASYCPRCGAPIEDDVDYCESCHHYIKSDVCSFCGAHLANNDIYCPECGSPRGGLVCPVCHTLNTFSFCRRCGTPLTSEAKEALVKVHSNPQYVELMKLTEEYADLENRLPLSSETDKQHEKKCENLRRRVMSLLAEDRGQQYVEPTTRPTKRMDAEDLQILKDFKYQQLTSLLESLQTPKMETPAKARTYAMARKPVGIRLGWVCNYKHAVHSGPYACAKPHLGGKWIVLNDTDKTETDDVK